MVGLNIKAFNQATQRLRRAQKHFWAMLTSNDVGQIQEAWSQLLADHHTAFAKLEKATKSGPAKGWYDRVKQIRKNDNLLAYVQHARNADNHGIDEIAEHETFKYLINPETNKIEIEWSWTHWGQPHSIIPRGDRTKLKILRQDTRIHLIPVTDRGTTYLPPGNHLGKPIDGSALAVAQLAISYLRSIIIEAKEKFG